LVAFVEEIAEELVGGRIRGRLGSGSRVDVNVATVIAADTTKVPNRQRIWRLCISCGVPCEK